MDLEQLKAMLREADSATEKAHAGFGEQSVAHQVALEIMCYEKSLHHGEASTPQYKKKIKEIIEDKLEEFLYEAD
ncbi:MAG: CxC ATPase DNA modification system associated small protein [Aeromonas sp.]